ncbi:MAG TPA: transketolase [Candidatus Dormibacteraeota bacterium]|nr:transketolase [Candidatus Dormibacteraeota bacterium]
MRERFAAVVTAALDHDPRLAVVLADISTGLFEAGRRRHPHRVLNVGIREQLLIGVCAGLALEGLRPVGHSYAPFLIERPFEQIKLDLGHQELGAVLVSIGASYDAAPEGRTHHAPGDVALLATLPGWTVHVPGHADEAEALLRSALAGDGLVYLRLTARENAAPRPVRPDRLAVVRRGGQGTVIAVGPLLDPVLAAVADRDVTVLYATTVRPLDQRTLRQTLVAPAVAVVEPYLAGTSVPALARALADRPCRLLGLGVGAAELHRYGSAAEHDTAHGLDTAGLRARLGAFLGG